MSAASSADDGTGRTDVESESVSSIRFEDCPTADDVMAEGMARDPDLRVEWERLAPARAVAIAVLRYRTDHDLSMTAFARTAGVSRQAVARLEDAEQNPSIETLARLATALGVTITITVGQRVSAAIEEEGR